MASTGDLTIENRNSSKTGLASSLSSQRSYGTVKDSPTLNHKSIRSSWSVIGGYLSHDVQEGDTLQGIALKYSVTVHEIRKFNNLWNSESVLSRTVLKVPFYVSRSLNPSPVMARATDTKNGKRDKRLAASFEDYVDSSDVKRKPVKGGSLYGERSIASVLDSADEQLRLSKEFADKLAKKSAAIMLPEGAYNMEREDSPPHTEHTPPPHSDKSGSGVAFSKFKLRRRKGGQTSDNLSQSREQLENDLFEL